MHSKWRNRAIWTAVLGLASASYGTCAWLWAAPYRERASPSSSEAALVTQRVEKDSTPAEPVPSAAGPIASGSAPAAAPAPIIAKTARTPALTSTRNFLVVGLDRRPD